MEGEIDNFFDNRAALITREIYESEQRYSRLFNLPAGEDWENLCEEEKALRVLALKSVAERGYLILGA